MMVQMKSVEQHFPVWLLIVWYIVTLTFECVDEILKCDRSNEQQFSCVPFSYAK